MKDQKPKTPSVQPTDPDKASGPAEVTKNSPKLPVEVGGPKGPEPTRYGDWEKAGRCTDF
jgi:hypothetical protein